jgi:predicted HAD superfamily phosphohydrolase YqeG
LRARYDECTSADGAVRCIAEHVPRTVIFDVEPLIAYWNTDTITLDEGVSRFIARTADIAGLQVIGFATNSHRRPSAMLAPSNVHVLYEAGALKPFRIGLFRDLPRPGVIVGDQIATDGVLAYRLGYAFVRYRAEYTSLPLGPRVMGMLGCPLRPLLFRA